MVTLKIKDETAAGKILNEITLQFENEYITVAQLIESRIGVELERYAGNLEYYRKGLVLPNELESRINKKKPITIDVDRQLEIAKEAFAKNGFFILIDDEQADELDQRFLIDETTVVSFVKLTPLVGG